MARNIADVGSVSAARNTQSSVDEAPYPTPVVGWYATSVLAFLFWMSLLDRFIISLLIEPIKADLGLTDVQFGVLQGLAFVVSFTVFGFLFGALADRGNRRRLIFIGVTLWSLVAGRWSLRLVGLPTISGIFSLPVLGWVRAKLR